MNKISAAAAFVLILVAAPVPEALAAAPHQRVTVSDANRDGRADKLVIVRKTACRGASARLGRQGLRLSVGAGHHDLSAKLPQLSASAATLELRCQGKRVLRRALSLRFRRPVKVAPVKPATITPVTTSVTTAVTTPVTPVTPTPTTPVTTEVTPVTPTPTSEVTTGDSTGWNILRNPIDPAQQTSIGWCKRSYWQQPWRGYLDTRPASTLANGAGINMNSGVGTPAFARTAAMLGRAGFRTARLEIGWREISYANPGAFTDPEALRAKLVALRDSGLRPVLLLNANHGDPGPVRVDWLQVTQPVGIGQSWIQLDAPSAAKVVPGLTGFGADKRPDILITAVDSSGRATLSRPMPIPVPAGSYQSYTLRYRPFTAPLTTAGTPHPVFEETLAGWMRYATAVADLATSVTGPGGFDIEVWNELSFGSDFLNIGNYYATLPNELRGTGAVTTTILARTTNALRDPARGYGTIGISDGFASQGPWESAAWEPAGLTTMSKHPYQANMALTGGRRMAACQPVDATGRAEGNAVGDQWLDAFTPTTGVLLPEFPLTALKTETMIRDLSPITTMIGNVPHGRAVTNPSDGKPLGVRITETGLIASSIGKSASDVRAMQARWAMRALVAFTAKGASSVELYGARDPEYGLVDESFFATPSAGDAAAGQTIAAIRRLVGAVGSSTPDQIQPLTLDAIADNHNHVQFAGDGTPAHPPLYNRDVVAAFPFQRGARSYAIPAYVMTRDMTKQLAPESYRLTFSGLATGPVAVTAYDPETDRSVPVQVTGRSGGTITVELALTDSPRVISIAPTAG